MSRKKSPKSLRQYWTPPLIADMMLEMVGYEPDWKVIDPACGEGVFLEAAARRGGTLIAGIDIDPNALEKARQNLAPYDITPRLYHQNGLLPIQDPNGFWQGEYDLVIGNPPFAARGYRVDEPEVLSRFTLSREPLPDTTDSLFPELPAYRKKPSVPIEVLFLERAIQLAKWNGKVALILPAGIFAGKSFMYVREWFLFNFFVIAIIELPDYIFHEEVTHARTMILYLIKRPPPPQHKVTLVLVEKGLEREPLHSFSVEDSQLCKYIATVIQLMEYMDWQKVQEQEALKK
ncbi:MAG: N-6 DNA methylase [Bacteroidia bacterium]|nr:N-6 DNA methylase [Bacteroidia bacterium]MDW8236457.1 N-6 DNA methylase [Bacteroidia bacterium]